MLVKKTVRSFRGFKAELVLTHCSLVTHQIWRRPRTVLNEIKFTYGTHGQVIKSEQDHDGAVTGGEPAVQYAYDTGVTSNVYNNGLRLRYATYPDGRKVHRTYGSADALADRLGRVAEINQDNGGSPGTALVAYAHNGTSRTVKVDYLVPDIRRQMFSSTGNYDAWDRFGRTKRQQWDKYGGSAGVRDQVDYTYDYAGNRLTRTNVLQVSQNQAYTYDGLHRLKSLDESTAASDRYWELDQLGNWDILRNGLTDTSTILENRTHNEANELTAFTTPAATIDPVHDLAGNMTTIPQPKDATKKLDLKYDAWNRVVEIKNENGTVVTTNEFDGLNRRIVRDETDGSGNHRHFYYNQQWQVLEEKVEVSGTINPNPLALYIYHPNYVDAIAKRYYDANTDGDVIDPGDGINYYLQDANFNVTAVTDNTGTVVERYAYTPYGEVTVLNPDFSAVTGNVSAISNELLYTGRRLDPETRLQSNRNRFYHAPLGRWVNRDPIGYEGSPWNLYEYVGSIPPIGVDPEGLGWPLSRYRPRFKPWPKPVPSNFKFCRRKIDAEDCCEKLANECCIEHAYIQYDKGDDKSGWGIGGIGAGNLPLPEKHFNPTSCKTLYRNGSLIKYGIGKGKRGKDATDGEIQDCISNRRMSQPYNKFSYNCIDWVKEAIRDCGLY